jgi:hypothetical protein
MRTAAIAGDGAGAGSANIAHINANVTGAINTSATTAAT